MQKLKWTTARLAFFVAVFGATATGNVLAFVLGPLYSWYFFNDLKCFKYYKYFYSISVSGWKMILSCLRDPAYRKMFAIPLAAPPMMGPNLSQARVRDSWPKDAPACNGCSQCCGRRACPLLDTESNRCRSYGSFFWRYFNCGRYPERRDQIEYYECSKWEIEQTS